MLLIYMKWDYAVAAHIYSGHKYVFERSGDWLYLNYNIRVSRQLE